MEIMTIKYLGNFIFLLEFGFSKEIGFFIKKKKSVP